MKLYEFEGIELFRRKGIPSPEYAITESTKDTIAEAKEIGFPVILKAQVLTGGRYLAGGVQTVNSPEDVEKVANRIFHLTIGGMPVQKLMVARKVESVHEFYMGVTIDEYRGTPIVILSKEGGVSINRVVQERPESLVSKSVPINEALDVNEAKKMCFQVGLRGRDHTEGANLLCSLFEVFRSYDALLAEINPLVRTKDGDYMALDSKVEIDDSSLYRHTDLNLNHIDHIANPLERKGREIGVSYIELDGDIGIIASGAGLGMASMDIISQRLRPANFLETGGAITAELLYKVMDLVLQKNGIRALFINVYGGINPIHEGAKGVVKYLKEHRVTIPVVAKALGNNQEETWEIFRSNGVHVVDDVSTEKGIDLLYRLLGEK